jgi:LPS sulfotransferase NodH
MAEVWADARTKVEMKLGSRMRQAQRRERGEPVQQSGFPLAYRPGGHERKVVAHFARAGAGARPGTGAEPTPSVFICFTNRCGSNYLAELLASTQKLPAAGEVFNWPYVVKQSEERGFRSFEEFCGHLVRTRSVNGVFAGKVGWSQLYFLTRMRLIPELFATPRFIHIRRRDVLGQAISYVIAKQTGQWKSDITRRERDKQLAQPEPVYDADAISARIKSFTVANALLEEFFASFRFPLYQVVYEDIIRDELGTIRAITDWLGLGAANVDRGQTRLEAQRSTVNQEWRERFISERMEYFASGAGEGQVLEPKSRHYATAGAADDDDVSDTGV